MKSRTSLAIISFVIPALLSAWCATFLFNAILQGLAPQVSVRYETLPTFGMVFFGLASIALPMVVLLGNRNRS